MAETTDRKNALSILRGQDQLVLWDCSVNWVVYEWQRQTPAARLIDVKGVYPKSTRLLGLPVDPPTALKKFDPRETLILNNLSYTRAAEDAARLISSYGDFRIARPRSLQSLAQAAGGTPVTSLPQKKLVGCVNDFLADFLMSPEALHNKERNACPKEVVNFFRSYDAQDYLRQALPLLQEKNAPELRPREGHVCLMIGGLRPGGAERQLCNLAAGLKRAGWTPTVLVYDVGAAETPAYRRFLKENGVAYVDIVPREGDGTQNALQALNSLPADMAAALWHCDPEFVLRVIYTYRALKKLRPALLISYLDWQNTISGLAGTMAGVPHVLLSGRNFAPDKFPHLYNKFALPAFRDIYRLALLQPSISFSNNTPSGARDYANWLRCPKSRLTFVPNGLTEDFTKPVSKTRLKTQREFFSVTEKDPFILGVFRITAEKRPEDFVRVVAALRRKYPRLKAALCGMGADNQSILNLIKKLKLEGSLRLCGVVEDIPAAMKAATLLLHPAAIEGMPNVLIEAQAMGLPVVCADSEGSRYALMTPWKKYVRKVGDAKGLTASCDDLLQDPAMAQKLADQAQRLALCAFSVEKLVRETLKAAHVSQKKTKRSA